MNRPKLTPRQKIFAEYCLLPHTFNTHTDAYIAVYKSKASRRTATANASRIYNMPAIQSYIDELHEEQIKRAVDRQELERKDFLDRLAGYRR